ncbi:glycosyltransferase, partial [Pseudanabaenaceae cyanobacterium LEGE 13415]|nr:glycosyltransferase [Pseudanabaenaceae cyanobacterium LEGE 13415]
MYRAAGNLRLRGRARTRIFQHFFSENIPKRRLRLIEGARIGVVIPCYKVTRHIMGVIQHIGPEVDIILCVDDACPDASGDFIEANCSDPRVKVLRNKRNRGVGGAVIRGYQEAIELNLDVVVKIDGDGQMDPTLLKQFA